MYLIDCVLLQINDVVIRFFFLNVNDAITIVSDFVYTIIAK